MGIFSEIERLINEPGSSTILKERILFLRQKHAAYQEECTVHKTKIAELGSQVRQLENEIVRIQEINKKLEFVNGQLKNQLDFFQYPDPEEHACGYCGSKQLKQTGSKPNPAFGDLGVKDAIFHCEDCEEETAVMIN
jgi:TolA-binding protein